MKNLLKIIESWTRVVGTLIELREEWEELGDLVRNCPAKQLEKLPISIQKHIVHPFVKAPFEKAITILISHYQARGGVDSIKMDQDSLEKWIKTNLKGEE